MATLHHGAPVIVGAKLKRRSERIGWRRSKKFWVVADFKAPKPGIFIGLRTIANGETEWGDSEEPTIFIRKENIRVALVSLDAKTNPIYVPLDKITVR